MDLDELLAESMTQREAKKAKPAAKKPKTLSQGRINTENSAWRTVEEKAEHQRQVEAITKKAEDWHPEAATLMFLVQCCQECGREHYHFAGIFVRQSHKRLQATRYAKPDAEIDYAKLPREVEHTRQYVPICLGCRFFTGWPDTLPLKII
jgi:hypothetical protein